jgi:phage FluMu protein Com
MPIPIRRPSCAATGTAPDAAAGKKVKCPKCKQLLTVPAPSRAVTPVTPAARHKPPVISREADEARSPGTPR